MTQNIPTFEKNAYGDYLVKSNGTNEIPENFDSKNKKVIYLGYTSCPSSAKFLYDSVKYGPLYASEKTISVHPYITRVMNINNELIDQLNGACCVILLKQQECLFSVLVKAKNKKYITNPVGFSEWGESFQQTAIRETLEETELHINNISEIAKWKFKGGFGGLSWDLCLTTGFYTIIDCPDAFDLSLDINKINLKNDNSEIEYLIVTKISSLESLDNLSDLHYNLVNLAVSKTKSGTYKVQRQMDFIDEFLF